MSPAGKLRLTPPDCRGPMLRLSSLRVCLRLRLLPSPPSSAADTPVPSYRSCVSLASSNPSTSLSPLPLPAPSLMAANGPPGGLPFHQYLQQQNQQQQQNSFGFAQQQQTGQQPHHQQQQQPPHGMQAQQAAFPNIPAHLLQGLGSNQQQGQASPSSRNSTPQTLSQLQLLQASQQYQQQQQQRQQQQQHLRQAQQRPSSSSASLAQPLPHPLPHPAQAGPSPGPPSNVPQPAAIVHALRSRLGGLNPPRWYEVEGQEAKRRRDPGPEQSGLGFEWPSVKKAKWEDKHGREQIKLLVLLFLSFLCGRARKRRG